MFASAVYLLCAATALACAALLLRGYGRSRARLLLWSGLCFVGLAADNVLLFIDVIVIPDIDFSGWRSLPAVAGIGLLLYGLVWETP